MKDTADPIRPEVDPGGLAEFSVVFTDRSLNSMSARFQVVMRDLSSGLRESYGAHAVAIVPGGGTFAMEAVARSLAHGTRALVIRNGWFSYRWSQILEATGGARDVAVVMARPEDGAYAPPPIEEAEAAIREGRPGVVFAPHVETSAGLILPDGYVTRLSAAAHEVGALMVLDCVASGCAWIDMAATGVDVLISAPQKGWSSTPCAGLVMMSEAAEARVKAARSDSFAMDLAKWRAIMEAYEGGGHAYHATMPTDGLAQFRDALRETRAFGYEAARDAQWRLGDAVRAALAERGAVSVAAQGYGAPGVVVSYTDDAAVKSGRAFAERGAQVAAGVPLMVGEPEGFSTFRIGLFGLDKLRDVEGTLARLIPVLDDVLGA